MWQSLTVAPERYTCSHVNWRSWLAEQRVNRPWNHARTHARPRSHFTRQAYSLWHNRHTSDDQRPALATLSYSLPACRVETCMGMGFPMGSGIPWESHGNGNKTQNWEWEWEGMGNHLSGNGNYLHFHGNLFPKVLCWQWCSFYLRMLCIVK